MAFRMSHGVRIWILRQIRLFVLWSFQIHVSSSTVDYGWLRNSTMSVILIYLWHGLHSFFRLTLELLMLHWIGVLHMSCTLSKIRNISPDKLTLTLVRVIEVSCLDVLGALNLAIVLLISILSLVTCILVHIVSHVYSSCTQKACGFVQSRIVLICSSLRVVHLSGIKLMTELTLISLILSSTWRVVIAVACWPRLDVFFVIELLVSLVVLFITSNDLWLMETRLMSTCLVILTSLRKEVLGISLILLDNAVGGSAVWLAKLIATQVLRSS